MKNWKEWPARALNDVLTSLVGWTCVIAATLVVGFCLGYWIGHREITSVERTLKAFAWIPLVWLGNAEMFIAYGVTCLAWYLPLHSESRWLRLVGAAANFFVWLLVIWWVVEKTSSGKFFRY